MHTIISAQPNDRLFSFQSRDDDSVASEVTDEPDRSKTSSIFSQETIEELDLINEYVYSSYATMKSITLQRPLTPVPSPKKSKFSALRGAFSSRSKINKIFEKTFRELKIPTPSNEETVIFGSYVAKWTSTLFKNNSKDFLVITQYCLCRLKTNDKMAKTFEGLPACISLCAEDTLPQQSSSAPASCSESILETLNKKIIPAESIILSLPTVYALSEQRNPVPSIRIDYISSPKKHAFLSLTSQHPELHEKWLQALKSAIRRANTIGPYLTGTQRAWIKENLISAEDFNEDGRDEILVAFRVLLRGLSDKCAPTNQRKKFYTPVMLVLGRSNLYIFPTDMTDDETPDDDHRPSNKSYMNAASAAQFLLDEKRPFCIHKYRYPLLCLTEIHADGRDDTFQLTFKNSNGSMIRTLLLSSTLCENIVAELRSAIDLITFWWPQPSYQLYVPTEMQATMIPRQDNKKISYVYGLGRMIEAQCDAFRVNRQRVAYSIEYVVGTHQIRSFHVENLPFRFTLLPPDNESYGTYTHVELLAVLNALRYHPLIHEIILKDINLFELQIQPSPEGHQGANMLAAILYDFLISNPRLRKLDLTGCGTTGDTLSAIGYALMTGQSSLERLVLADNTLNREGVQALASGITAHGTPLKELDLSNGRLTQKVLESIIYAIDTDEPEQLEILNLSKNSCGLDSYVFVEFLANTLALKTLNLRDCPNFFKGAIPLISIRTLGNTMLTTLDLGGCPLNRPDHLEALCKYIQSGAFFQIRFFSIDHCSLDGIALSAILPLLVTLPDQPKLHVWIGGNNIVESAEGLEEFCRTIRTNQTPQWLSMVDCLLGKNPDQVTDVLTAFRDNTVIEVLDLSYPQFGVPPGDDQPNPMVPMITERACEELGNLFRENRALTELTLRGDDNKRWGPTLGLALEKLEDNLSLTKLNICGNSIGDAGAKCLATALKANSCLCVLNIDENEIGLEGYLSLHNVLITHQNITLQEIEYPTEDLKMYIETLSTKTSILRRESLQFSLQSLSQSQSQPQSQSQSQSQSQTQTQKASTKEKEKKKHDFNEVVDEIMSVVQLHSVQNSMYYHAL